MLSVFINTFLTFHLSNKQTSKTQSHCDASLCFWYFYLLDVEVFVIYYFITQAADTIMYMQMQTFKYMNVCIRAFYTNHYGIHNIETRIK